MKEAEAKTAEATEKFKVDPSKVIRKAPIMIYEHKSEPEPDETKILKERVRELEGLKDKINTQWIADIADFYKRLEEKDARIKELEEQVQSCKKCRVEEKDFYTIGLKEAHNKAVQECIDELPYYLERLEKLKK